MALPKVKSKTAAAGLAIPLGVAYSIGKITKSVADASGILRPARMLTSPFIEAYKDLLGKGKAGPKAANQNAPGGAGSVDLTPLLTVSKEILLQTKSQTDILTTILDQIRQITDMVQRQVKITSIQYEASKRASTKMNMEARRKMFAELEAKYESGSIGPKPPEASPAPVKPDDHNPFALFGINIGSLMAGFKNIGAALVTTIATTLPLMLAKQLPKLIMGALRGAFAIGRRVFWPILILDTIYQVGKALIEDIRDKFFKTNNLKERAMIIVDAIVRGISKVIDDLTFGLLDSETVMKGYDKLKQFIAEFADNIGGWLTRIKDRLVSAFSGSLIDQVLTNMFDGLKNTWNAVFQSIADKTKQVFTDIGNWFGRQWNAIIDELSSWLDTVGLGDKLSSLKVDTPAKKETQDTQLESNLSRLGMSADDRGRFREAADRKPQALVKDVVPNLSNQTSEIKPTDTLKQAKDKLSKSQIIKVTPAIRPFKAPLPPVTVTAPLPVEKGASLVTSSHITTRNMNRQSQPPVVVVQGGASTVVTKQESRNMNIGIIGGSDPIEKVLQFGR